jgi:hypothetical protein
MLSVDVLKKFAPVFRCDAWVLHRGNERLATRSGAATVNEMEVNSGLNTFEGIVVEVLKWGPLRMSKAEIGNVRTYHGKRDATYHFLL